MPLRRRGSGCCLCAIFLPLHKPGHSEQCVILNFRGLGTGYCHVLLSFAILLLLAVLVLGPNLSLPQLSVSIRNQAAPGAFAPNFVPEAQGTHLDLSQLPLSFEQNQGQTDQRVRFLARGASYALFLTEERAVLTLRSREKRNSVIRMQLAGANPVPAVSGSNQLPGKSNYFIGNDSTKWLRDIPQFARVRYQNIYPGIGLVYYGREGKLEYDFEVRQDGKFGFELGAYDRRRTLIIDPVLTYSTYLGGSGDEACPAGARVLIAGVSSPPSGCPAVAIDASSNIYIAGSTTSIDFPVVPTPPLQALAVAPDIFVTKLNAAGSAIVFSTYLGGDGVDTSAGIAVDSAFNVVVSGTTASTNFPTSGTSAFQSTPASANPHAFVSELVAAGNALSYSSYLSGNGAESARGLALDSRNKIYVIGTTTSTNVPDATHSFPATVGAIQTSSLAANQFFVSKIDPTLIGFPSLVYSTYFGGGNPSTGTVAGGGIAVDANSNVYITGGTNFLHTGSATTDFPIVNAYQGCLDTPPTSTATTNCSTSVTAMDAFVAKINPTASSGAQLLYSTYLGGSGDDVGYGIAVDSGLSAYVTGSTASTDFIIPTGTTAFQGANGGGTDAFVGKLGNPCTGSTCTTTTVPLNYFSYLGGSGTD